MYSISTHLCGLTFLDVKYHNKHVKMFKKTHQIFCYKKEKCTNRTIGVPKEYQ